LERSCARGERGQRSRTLSNKNKIKMGMLLTGQDQMRKEAQILAQPMGVQSRAGMHQPRIKKEKL
jgi:hypothetical protein